MRDSGEDTFSSFHKHAVIRKVPTELYFKCARSVTENLQRSYIILTCLQADCIKLFRGKLFVNHLHFALHFTIGRHFYKSLRLGIDICYATICPLLSLQLLCS